MLGCIGRLLLATMLLGGAIATTGACGGGSEEPSPTPAAAQATTPTSIPVTSTSTVAPAPSPTPTSRAVPTPTLAPIATSTPTPVPTPSQTPAPTPTTTPTPEATSEPTVSSDDGFIDFDEETTWQDVYDALSTSEQSCIHDAIDDDALESLLQLKVLREASVAEPMEIGALFCLEPEKAEVLYTSAVIASMGDVSPETVACVNELVAGLELATFLEFILKAFAGEEEEATAPPEEMFEFMMGMMACGMGELGSMEDSESS